MIVENIFYAQESYAEEWIEKIQENGPESVLEELKAYHYLGEHDTNSYFGYGRNDEIFQEGRYILYWNTGIPTIGLGYILEKQEQTK